MLKQSLQVLSFIISTFIIIFLYQNCSQPGELKLEADNSATKISSPADSMVIVDDSTDDHQNDDSNLEIEEDQTKLDCSKIKVADINLNLLKINVQSEAGEATLSILEEDKNLSLEKLSIRIKSSVDITVNKLFLVLDQTGNKLLDESSKVYSLKTPSGQTSGLKVHLSEKTNLLANKEYLLKLVINIEDQLVLNPSKCLFKPVLRGASISESEELQ